MSRRGRLGPSVVHVVGGGMTGFLLSQLVDKPVLAIVAFLPTYVAFFVSSWLQTRGCS